MFKYPLGWSDYITYVLISFERLPTAGVSMTASSSVCIRIVVCKIYSFEFSTVFYKKMRTAHVQFLFLNIS